jgi:Leucine-rich repeat (LRR) protein
MRIELILFLIVNITVFSQTITIPDPIFKAYLLKNKDINSNGDNEIQVNEALSFDGNMDCSGLQISDLVGIQEFKNLSSLSCSDNKLKNLDISLNSSLIELDCSYNQIETLNLLGNTLIENLSCSDNKLTNLEISNCNKLKRLDCKNNLLQLLDLEKNVKISWVSCESNPFECVSNVPLECRLIGGKRCERSLLNKVDVNATNLKNNGNRGDVIKLRKSGIPVNGIVKFTNGELKCVEGKIILEIFYYKNGNLKSRCQYKDGFQNGLQEFFYKNGNKKFASEIETKFIDKLESKKQKIVYTEFWSKKYFRNGQLKTDIVYKNGLISDKICYNKRGKCIKCKLF